jgi:hypothetical protein
MDQRQTRHAVFRSNLRGDKAPKQLAPGEGSEGIGTQEGIKKPVRLFRHSSSLITGKA